MLEGLAPNKKDALCILMSKAADLDKSDYDILMEALESPLWSSNGLSEALRSRGFIVHKGAVANHRKKTCSCAR
jgi:hypothetical protein